MTAKAGSLAALTLPAASSGNTFNAANEMTAYFYRARYYSPTFERFVSQDPIGFAGGDTNLYSYIGDNPVSFRDEKGSSAREFSPSP